MSRLDEVRELLAVIAPTPWCKDWLYTAIRHVVRNCDLECGSDVHSPSECSQPNKYDGDRIAALVNAIPFLLSELERKEARESALADFYTAITSYMQDRQTVKVSDMRWANQDVWRLAESVMADPAEETE